MSDVVFTTSCPGCGLTFDGVPGGPNCPNCHAELPGYVGADEPGWVDQSPDPSVLVHSWASEGDPAIEQTGVSSVTPSQMPWTPPPDPVEPAAPEPPAENAAVAGWVAETQDGPADGPPTEGEANVVDATEIAAAGLQDEAALSADTATDEQVAASDVAATEESGNDERPFAKDKRGRR